MVIKNITSYDKSNIHLLQNGVNDIDNKNMQKSNNPIKSSICGKKDTEIPHSNNVNKVISPEMKRLIQKLDMSEKSELDTQRGMSFLHQKKKYLDTIEAIGHKLEDLSKQYKDSSTTEEDKTQKLRGSFLIKIKENLTSKM